SREAEETARANFNPGRFHADSHRDRHGIGVAKAELTNIVGPPRPQRAIALQAESVSGAAFDLKPVRVHADTSGHRLQRCAAHAQLAKLIRAPRPKCSVRLNRE